MATMHSEIGLKTLKATLQGDCSKMINDLTGSEYKTLISTIKQYWAGSEAEEWVNDLETTVKNLSANIKKVSQTAQGYLDQDLASIKSAK